MSQQKIMLVSPHAVILAQDADFHQNQHRKVAIVRLTGNQ